MKMFDPHNLQHYCGGPVKTIEHDGRWGAVCEGCGATKNDCETAEELILKWYGLKQERECADDIEGAMKRLLTYFTKQDGEVYSKELLVIGGAGAKRALSILDCTGLVRTRYEIEGAPDVPVEEAMEANRNGATVRVFCRSNFKMLETM